MGKHLSYSRLAGQTFGYLTVLRRAGRSRTNALWLCRCACGEEITARSDRLKAGLRKACAVNGHRWRVSRPPGLAGQYLSEHQSWENMKARCYDKKNERYKSYGGRGIRVCAEWRKNFAKFLEDLGPKPDPKLTIDRKDVNGHYEKENCRWATRAEQYRNTTRSVFVKHEGEKVLLMDLAKRFGIPLGNVYNRLKIGWPLEKALVTPVRTKKSGAA